MVTVNSYFSGAGLLDLGLMRGGLSVQQSFEMDKACCDTLALNFDHEIVRADITRKPALLDRECDVMVAGYPCTKYSPIADIHGVRTGDDLFLHYFRHLALRRPELYALENVPGMRKFPVVMEAMTKLPDYYVHVICPVKSETWLPQRRDRLIIIGSRKRFTWREPTARKPIPLANLLEADPKPYIPEYVKKRIEGKYRDKPIVSDPSRGDIAPTCVAHYAKDPSTRLVVDSRFPYGLRPYTVREYARLQGVPDGFQFAGVPNDAYRMIGNGVSVPVGEWLAAEIKRYFKAHRQ